jgi:hypothetical protein
MKRRGRPPGAGRPSKGAREYFGTRLPAELAALVRAESDRLDLSYSEYIANILAVQHGVKPISVDDAQMKLTA